MTQRDKDKLLRHFAHCLGWRGLRRLKHVVRESGDPQLEGFVIRWYESGSHGDPLLQINENPPWHAAVYAIRYRIFTGWHKFTILRGKRCVVAEAERLRTYLDRRWFFDAEQRRAFRRLHPACAGWTWTHIRTDGQSYPP